MSTAVLLSITTPALEATGRIAQALIVPDASRPRVFTRTTNGSKGRNNAWGPTFYDGQHELYPDGSTLLSEPVAITVTESDRRDLRDKGWCATLAKKALKFLESTPTSEGENANEVFATLYQQVLVDSSELEQYKRDQRRARPSVPVESRPHPVAQPHQPLEASALVTVPDPELGETYVSRTLAGGVSDFDLLEYSQEERENVLLLGPTGSGKTLLPLAFASAKKLKCYSVSGNLALEPSQLFGKFSPTAKGEFAWIDGPITTLVRHGGVLILDEINLISPKILTVLYSLLDARREITLLDHVGETIKAHPELLIVGTGNPGYVGTGPLSEALLDRWQHRWSWGYDHAVEDKLVKSKSLLAAVEGIRSRGDIDTPVSTRLMVEFEKTATRRLGFDLALEELLNRFISDVEQRDAVKVVLSASKDAIKKDLFDSPENEADLGDDDAEEEDTYEYPWERDLVETVNRVA